MTLTSSPATSLREPDAPMRFHRRSTWRQLPLRSKVSLWVIIMLALASALASFLPLPDPLNGTLSNRLEPLLSPHHVLGTDTQGRDLLSRTLYATRTSLFIAVTPIIIATAIGMILGAVGALARSVIATPLMRLVDVVFAFPAVLLALLLAVSLGPGVTTLLIALTIVWFPPLARVATTEIARIRELDYYLAARASGASTLSIVSRQVVPVALPAVVAYATSLVGANVAIAGGLGFLGLGVQAPDPELGSMLQEMQAATYSQPWLALVPAVVIVLLSVLFPIVGDGFGAAISGRGAES